MSPFKTFVLAGICILSFGAKDARADFLSPSGQYQHLVRNLYMGRFGEVFGENEVSLENERQKAEGLIAALLYTYHEAYASVCQVSGDAVTYEVRNSNQGSSSSGSGKTISIRREFANDWFQAQGVMNSPLSGLIAIGGNPGVIFDLAMMSRDIAQRNGCASAELSLFEQNLSRAFRGQSSVQETGQAPTLFRAECQRTKAAGLLEDGSRDIAATCQCIEQAFDQIIQSPGDRRLKQALEDNFTLRRLLGDLASSPEVWTQAQACFGVTPPAQPVAEAIDVHTEDGLRKHLMRVGCLQSEADADKGIKRRNAIRCVQEKLASGKSAELSEEQLTALVTLPDADFAENSKLVRPDSNTALDDQPRIDGLDPRAFRYAPGLRAPVAIEDPAGRYVEFPDLGLRLKDIDITTNNFRTQVVAIREYGPAWFYGQDDLAPGDFIDEDVRRLTYAIQNARRAADQRGVDRVPIGLGRRVLEGSEYKTRPPQRQIYMMGRADGAWLTDPYTAHERARLSDLQAATARVETFKADVVSWISRNKCRVSEDMLKDLDLVLGMLRAKAAMEFLPPGHVYDWDYQRRDECERVEMTGITPIIRRYNIAVRGTCELLSPEGADAFEQLMRENPIKLGGYRMGILLVTSQHKKPAKDLACIADALREDFLRPR